MDRRSAYVLLAVIGVGVFLAGLELMVTAVALPSILADLAPGIEERGAQVGIGKGVEPLLSHLKPSYQSLEAATGTALTPGYPVSAAVAVAQLVEPRVVVPVVGGSSPLRHLSAVPYVHSSRTSITCRRTTPARIAWQAIRP